MEGRLPPPPDELLDVENFPFWLVDTPSQQLLRSFSHSTLPAQC